MARNSPYTTALVKHLTTPGLDLRLALGRVRDEVLKSTSNRQEPFVYGSLGGTEIALVAAPAATAPPQTPTYSDAAEAVRVCREVAGIASRSVLAVLANQHKGTPAGDCIAARIEELKKVAAATPPSVAKPAPSSDALSRFDGQWVATVVCPKTVGAGGYNRALAARVKSGMLEAQDGEKGRPNWLIFEGRIEPDGKALIRASGLIWRSRLYGGKFSSRDRVLVPSLRTV